MEHAPLTPKDIEFLNKAQAGPVELSTVEMMSQGLNLNYLHTIGYLSCEQTYADPEPGKARFRWTRTSKPLP